jgi:hypothetical protein
MEILDFTVVNNDVVINTYPALPYDTTITVFNVPTTYRTNGFMVVTDNDIPQVEPVSILRTESLEKNMTLYIQHFQQFIIGSLTLAVQTHLDTVAKTKNYDDIFTCCSYATSDHIKFGAEGRAAVAWRDAVWDYCYGLIPQVLAGQIQIPTEEELITALPTISW